jgi:hypothetical protein
MKLTHYNREELVYEGHQREIPEILRHASHFVESMKLAFRGANIVVNIDSACEDMEATVEFRLEEPSDLF